MSPRRFILKTIICWLLPTAVLAAIYLAADPMLVLRWHEDMIPDGFIPNKGNVTVKQFEHNVADKKYDSFIIGTSVTIYYSVADWKKYLPDGASPYHFDSSAMSGGQMLKSVKYLSERATMKNVLFVSEVTTLADDHEGGEYVFATPPELEDNLLKGLATHFDFFCHWYSRGNLNGFVADRLLGTKAVGVNRYPADHRLAYVSDINEETMPRVDAMLDSLSKAFEKEHPGWPQSLSDSTYTVMPPVIGSRLAGNYREIARILEEKGTDYRFVLAPDRYRRRLNPADSALLTDIFGPHFVDVSRELEWLTCNPYLFYDNVHHRPEMAEIVLERVYR